MRKSNYDKRPVLHVRTKGVSAWQGWEAIGAQLRKAIADKPDAVVCVDCYHGVWESDVLSALTKQLNPSRVFCTAQATLPKEQVNAMLKDHLTDDRVFGIMAHYRIEQFFDMERVAALRQEIALAHGVRLVFGVGAALLCADGRVFQGCNIENASFGLTNCAERTAMFKAVSEGAREFTAIAIASRDAAPWPCGACRQVLNEFAPNIRVLVTWQGGTESATLPELLPHGFGPQQLTTKE